MGEQGNCLTSMRCIFLSTSSRKSHLVTIKCLDLNESNILLRVQNEQFPEEKEFILRYTEKKVSFPSGFEHPIPGLRSERSTTEPSDLLMNGHKNSVYQVHNKLFTIYSGIRNCHKMTNCEQFRTK